jgi:hypothetical protein
VRERIADAFLQNDERNFWSEIKCIRSCKAGSSTLSSAVRVFISRSPFSRLDDINVQGLIDPSDIVVCNDKSQLYIADLVAVNAESGE